MTECKATWWRACKFKARYDEQIPETIAKNVTKVSGRMADACGVKVYVRDVCERCGKTIERGAS